MRQGGVRDTLPESIQLDGVLCELVPSDDTSLWDVLHDGCITRLARSGPRVSVSVSCEYLRSRFSEPGDGFVLELLDVTHVALAPPGGAAVQTSLDEITASEELYILSGELEKSGEVVVHTDGGALRLHYGALALRFDSGAALAPSALRQAAHAYWDELSRKNGR